MPKLKLEKQFAVKALVENKNHFLFLKKKDFLGGDYDLPGGRKKQGGKDLLALKREVKEETGLEITTIQFLNNWQVDVSSKGINLNGKTYLRPVNSNEVILSEEHFDYKWLPKEQVLRENIPYWAREALEKI